MLQHFIKSCHGNHGFLRAQELCENRGGGPGFPSLISLRFLWTWSITWTSWFSLHVTAGRCSNYLNSACSPACLVCFVWVVPVYLCVYTSVQFYYLKKLRPLVGWINEFSWTELNWHGLIEFVYFVHIYSRARWELFQVTRAFLMFVWHLSSTN